MQKNIVCNLLKPLIFLRSIMSSKISLSTYFAPLFPLSKEPGIGVIAQPGAKIPNPGWCRANNFVVPPDVVDLPLPDIDVLIQKLPANHPKLFIRPENKQAYSQSLKEKFETLSNWFLINAQNKSTQAILKEETAALPSDGTESQMVVDVGAMKSRTVQINTAVETAVDLAFAYLVSDEVRYGERAREWLLAMSSWPLDGNTSFVKNPDCSLAVLRGMAKIYTWIYPFLVDADKKNYN